MNATRKRGNAATGVHRERRNPASRLKVGFGAASLFFASIAFGADTGENDQLQPLLPPQPEIPPGFWELYLWHVVAGGMVLLGLLALAAWWVTRPRTVAAVPPAAQAREALETLADQPETGPVLTRVCQVVRGYFAAVFELPPGALTTGEFARAVMASERAAPELARSAVELLRTCDERKFAPEPPRAPLHAVSDALKLIERAELCLAQSLSEATQTSSVAPERQDESAKPSGGS